MIDEHKNDQSELSPKSMANRFGEEIIGINLFYMHELTKLKLVIEEYQLDTKKYHIKLTPLGQEIVTEWSQIAESIIGDV